MLLLLLPFLLLILFAQLESAAEANRILLESNRSNKTTKKKKRAASAGKSPNGRRPPVRRRHPTNARPSSEHYRLNLAEIPFINGKVGLVQVQLVNLVVTTAVLSPMAGIVYRLNNFVFAVVIIVLKVDK